ncbi:DUF1573 domain-containing protein [Sediminibacterium sp.]|uniref:DUF1573 domain-containing protein n=1 Tax=Sediminibacterium sp. TaxID=1917865 RepID=UPI0025DB33D0|nr:DUF1573 domain-containing protein [Sediminibacterium sp.]MDP2419997.1 DUF1573 domain-containing protein [Sediminibacterium sp.]
MMKTLIKMFIIIVTVNCSSCSNKAEIHFDNIDLGKIEIKDTVYGEAKIQNIGNKPLKINRVVASCNCTTTGYDTTLIAKGDFVVIKYKISLKDTGYFSKKVTFSANTKDQFHSFTISGVAFENTLKNIDQ